MNKLIACVCVGLLFVAATPVFAGEQQNRMKSCNKEAADKALKGEERKAFMKNCLSSKPEAPAAPAAPAEAKKAAPQEKMKSCNKDARDKGLKGDERKKFMSSCLKG